MDGLLQALGVCLIQNKTKPSQNLLTLLAFYIHRISKGLADWNEKFTGRNHFICAYLSGIGRCSTDHGASATSHVNAFSSRQRLLVLASQLLFARKEFRTFIFPTSLHWALVLLVSSSLNLIGRCMGVKTVTQIGCTSLKPRLRLYVSYVLFEQSTAFTYHHFKSHFVIISVTRFHFNCIHICIVDLGVTVREWCFISGVLPLQFFLTFSPATQCWDLLGSMMYTSTSTDPLKK